MNKGGRDFRIPEDYQDGAPIHVHSFATLPATPILVDYFCAIRIEQNADAAVRKCWLAIGVSSNLVLLAYFKYANFFLENIAVLAGTVPRHLEIVLPLGISFFKFKSLSYTIDVYRGDLPPCRSLWRYAMFVCYFPDLIAGPIVRASVFFPQMKRPLRPSWRRTAAGCQMILLGLTKKLLIAEKLSVFVDPVFAEAGTYSPQLRSKRRALRRAGQRL